MATNQDTPEGTTKLSSKELEEIKRYLDEVKREKPLGIIVTGKSKTGKSALLNALIEQSLFPENDSEDEDSNSEDEDDELFTERGITEECVEKEGVKIRVWDCPGLQDGVDYDEKNLEPLRGKADLMLYCIDIQQPRSANEFAVHNSAVEKITRALGQDIWKCTLVALTFANIIVDRLKTSHKETFRQKFEEKVQEWERKFKDSLQYAGVDDTIVDMVQVMPAGNRNNDPELPGHQDWVSDFFCACLVMVKESNEKAYIKLLLVSSKKLVLKGKLITAIGATAGGATAGVVGATVGSTIGALAIGIPSFGIAAGLGLVIGGVIGGGSGVVVSLLSTVLAKRINAKRVAGKLDLRQPLVETEL